MASAYVPPVWRRSQGIQVDRLARSGWRTDARAHERGSFPLLVLVASVVFVITAGALLVSQSGVFSRPASVAPVTQAPSVPPPSAVAPLAPADAQYVLSFARGLRQDDPLVQVRPGVLAKKSNVEGVEVGGRTVFYDVTPHQSYGPLRTGKLSESQVEVLARDTESGALILVYAKK
jgi:hypothetical protein